MRGGGRGRSAWLPLLLLAALPALPARAGAQCASPGVGPWGEPLPCRSGAGSHALNAGVNVAIGALTAGVRAHRADRPVLRATLGGAAGGAVAYGGRRLMAAAGPGRYTGLLGRQVGAVGASIVRNAGDGRGALAGVVLPVGPVRLYLNEPRSDGGVDRLRARLDLNAAVTLVHAATRDGATFDAGESLAAGAPVFRNVHLDDERRRLGVHRAGTVRLSGRIQPAEVPGVLGHELVHVSQYDFAHIALTEPLERALRERTPTPLAAIGRHVDVGVNQLVWSVLNGLIPHRSRLWEDEAYLMTEGRWAGGAMVLPPPRPVP